MEPPSYRIQEGDRIETRSYYTIGQLMEFMDVELDMDKEILVNNRDADLATLVYENFEVEWTVLEASPEPEGETTEETNQPEASSENSIEVLVNGETITMTGKQEYVYVDVFNYIDFNLNDPRGRTIMTLLNGENADYTAVLKNGDKIDIYWEERD